jgi:GTPase
VLGVLEADERQLVLADIPGLIEGASEGAGLGHDFLAHVERTRLLVHVLDVAPELTGGEGADPLANHATIERELMAHDPRLAELPRVLALSKCDLLDEARVNEVVAQWRERLGEDVPVIATSSATGLGLEQLSSELLLRVAPQATEVGGEGSQKGDFGALPAGQGAGGVPAPVAIVGVEGADEDLAEHMVFRPAGRSGFSVERRGPKSFAVRGAGIERLLARYDVDNDDAMAYFEGRLRRIGVLKALEAEGFQAGDEIEIAGETFELDPE